MLPAALLVAVLAPGAEPPPLPGFRGTASGDELVREEWVGDGVRALASASAKFDPKRPTRLVIYATPNGTTIEQTLGRAPADRLDWRFDSQHVAAQVRKLREVSSDANVVLACIEADGLSWPAWKRGHKDGPARIAKAVAALRAWVPGDTVRVSLAGHSGGGSFLFGFLDASPAVPEFVERVVFLDANYSYSDADRHGDKQLAWLKPDRGRRHVVIAYDDRKVTLGGKPVVGPDGGTFRATERMRARFAKDLTFAETTADDITARAALDGRLVLLVHANPENRVLHTALVGEMNGLLCGLTDPGARPAWGTFGGPRAYTKLVQPAPGIPKRPAGAPAGTAVF
jgi:hypothetical protein